ncbi:MAG: acetoin dehydrogenase [Nitrospirae bacterium GWF2_44_13]|nr:MAG: acetoin dehydrogenase [Nitrospirae bacterium GWF2_44_13]OGW63508.1 MAG: acetoin dehydrogenase [Nitrospirae bacterium RIFOXYA2_FULL_44_9]
MKAAILYKTGHPLVIEDGIDIPELNPGQVLIKVLFSGVCHSQLMEVRGKRGEDRYLPHMLGHEGSGEVIAIGDSVTKVKPGDKVILGWIKGEGMDVSGAKYVKDKIIVNAGPVTTFSDYSIVSENRCVKLPEGIPLDVAVLFGCVVPTGSGIVMNHIKPVKGSSIAIFGMGGIGLSVLMAAFLFECNPIIAIDIEDDKLNIAGEFGATHEINAMRKDPLAEIYKITDHKCVDYSVDASGNAKTIETAFKAVRNLGGLCVFASHPPYGNKIELDPYDLICGKRIEGSWGGACKPDKDIPVLADLYRNGKMPLEKLLSKKYALEEINEALEDLESRKIARAVIEMER